MVLRQRLPVDPGRYVEYVLSRLLDALFPPRCGGCGRLGMWFCDRCQRAVEPVGPFRVEGLEAVYAGGVLTGPLQHALHAYKYQPRPQLAEALARIAARAVDSPVALVVPVPLHAARARQRGFDQGRALARPLARLLHTEYRDALTRVRDTPAQVGLGAGERERNVAGAFAWSRSVRPPARVLLVDDVVTTGATLRACAAAARTAGAGVVEAAVIARARELD
jgi:ComF family protein